jgi:amidase
MRRLRMSSTLLAVMLAMPFMPAAVATAAPSSAPQTDQQADNLGFDLDAATIPQLQQRMDQGQLTSVQLTTAYLQRIHKIDPMVHSVLFLDSTAMQQAAASDQRRAAGKQLGPLDGIPVLLKDNVDTANMPTTAGSRAMRTGMPPQDAVLVQRLRAAGAVITGKTNLSEWANFRSTHSTSGWSGVGGQTNNPYVLDRNPCGSSSGSGAAEAASLTQVAIGTETDGSIVCPSGTNGDVGIKPTLGVISGGGIVPISSKQDTAGPIARHVIDAALTLSVVGQNSADAASLRPDALRGARIGVWRMAGQDPAVDAIVQSAVDTLTKQGATVVDVDLPFQDQIGANEFPALLTEFRHDLEQYLSTRPQVPQTLADLIKFNEQDPIELSKFGQEIFSQSEAAPPESDPNYQQERATATSLAKRSIDDTLAANHLDAILAPTNGPAWKTDYATGDVDVIGSSTPAAVAGYPDVTVPAGFEGPLPIGVSFMASANSDAQMLSFAAGFEQASGARKAPTFLPTLPQ